MIYVKNKGGFIRASRLPIAGFVETHYEEQQYVYYKGLVWNLAIKQYNGEDYLCICKHNGTGWSAMPYEMFQTATFCVEVDGFDDMKYPTAEVEAMFLGTNKSLGYETDKRYNLLLRRQAEPSIVKIGGGGACSYGSYVAFYTNWFIFSKRNK